MREKGLIFFSIFINSMAKKDRRKKNIYKQHIIYMLLTQEHNCQSEGNGEEEIYDCDLFCIDVDKARRRRF